MTIVYERIVNLFKLKPGITIQSYAVYCAKQCGISEELLKRIEDV